MILGRGGQANWHALNVWAFDLFELTFIPRWVSVWRYSTSMQEDSRDITYDWQEEAMKPHKTDNSKVWEGALAYECICTLTHSPACSLKSETDEGWGVSHPKWPLPGKITGQRTQTDGPTCFYQHHSLSFLLQQMITSPKSPTQFQNSQSFSGTLQFTEHCYIIICALNIHKHPVKHAGYHEPHVSDRETEAPEEWDPPTSQHRWGQLIWVFGLWGCALPTVPLSVRPKSSITPGHISITHWTAWVPEK
jgi:hypothetical protein